MLFFPIQYELDCINDSGDILGRIKFDNSKNEYIFYPNNESIVLSDLEKASIAERLSDLESGKYLIPMQDDDWYESRPIENFTLWIIEWYLPLDAKPQERQDTNLRAVYDGVCAWEGWGFLKPWLINLV